MKKVILLTTIYSQPLFFSVLAILGVEYGGITESSSYLIFCALSAVFSLSIFLIDGFILGRFSFNGNTLLFLLLPAFISLIYFAEKASSEIANRFFTYYLIFSLTSTYVGIYVARMNWIGSMAKWLEIVMIIFTGGVVSSVILPFIRGSAFTTFAGSTYQTASYISASAFSLNLFFILFENKFTLFKFHNFKFYKIMMYIFLLVQIAGVLISGGRGGFVLVFLALLIFLWLKNKDQKLKIGKILMIVLFFVLSGMLFLPKLLQNKQFLTSSRRVFSYISSSGIDMSQTSGRDYVYRDAIQLIGEKPFTGYGLFGYYDYMHEYPHNIFLEILLNGGILYLIITLFIGWLFLRKLRLIILQEPANLLILVIFIYPMTELMFSGTYMATSLFWFIITYVFCYNFQDYEVRNELIMK